MKEPFIHRYFFLLKLIAFLRIAHVSSTIDS